MLKISEETQKPIAMANCHDDIAHEDLCFRTQQVGIPFIDGTRDALRAVKHLFDFRDRRPHDDEHLSDSLNQDLVSKWREKLVIKKGANAE